MSPSRLLKKPDQCHSVATCAHVHCPSKDREVTECKDPKRVLECLKKAGRIAPQCMDTSVQVQLLVELLNTYMLFYEKGNEQSSSGDVAMYEIVGQPPSSSARPTADLPSHYPHSSQGPPLTDTPYDVIANQ
ncbi:Vacuolar protein sorting-associated protein 35 [Geodia barretti]|uniref:Vacuolar protein sorting-associated protein 35 n=1 Tax=Geodia barretti TaxID=519541 RepID=A0AA35TI11_GEOBA|nr:Vacuolar protein sorting-associated protein 35 [Geodia barretti]